MGNKNQKERDKCQPGKNVKGLISVTHLSVSERIMVLAVLDLD